MTSFVLTIDELNAAPAEIRHWVLGRVEADLLRLASAGPPPAGAHAPSLAACTPAEAAQVFELIRADYAAAQVFIELARESASGEMTAPLYAANIGNLMRHTRLSDGALFSCLQTINQAFRQVRRDPEAMLFAFDQANHVYVHAATHRSIYGLWRELVQFHASAAREAANQAELPTVGFAPQRLGSSEEVGGHRAG